MGSRAAALFLSSVLAVSACASAPEPAPPPRATLVPTDRQLDAAVAGFLDEVDARAAQGWPPEGGLLSEDTPPRLAVRIDVESRTRDPGVAERWRTRMEAGLLARGMLTTTRLEYDGALRDSPRPAYLRCLISEERRVLERAIRADFTIRTTLEGPRGGQPLASSVQRSAIVQDTP